MKNSIFTFGFGASGGTSQVPDRWRPPQHVYSLFTTQNKIIMKNLIAFLTFICVSGLNFSISAQDRKPVVKSKKIKMEKVGKTSFIKKKNSELIVVSPKLNPHKDKIVPISADGHLDYRNKEAYIKYIKSNKDYNKNPYPKTPDTDIIDDVKEEKKLQFNEAPFIGGPCPPDNAFGISDKGYILTANNKGLRVGVFTTNNNEINISGEMDFEIFFANQIQNGSIILDAENSFFDPKIYYSHQRRQFFLVVLFKSKDINQFVTSSKVILCTTFTENPDQGWVIQIFDDHFQERAAWFDYPSIGFNNNEIFISGNLFGSLTNLWVTNYIYQIKCNVVGANETVYALDYLTHDRIEEPWSNNFGFTILPVSHGKGQNYGAGIFMVSTEEATYNNSIYLYNITGGINDNPEIEKYTIDIEDFEPTGHGAFQKNGGDTSLLATGDNRIQSAFFQRNRIHLVFSKRSDNDESLIQYYRFKVEDLEPLSYIIRRNTNSYAYPAIASIGYRRAIVGFLRSSKDVFPQVRLKRINRRVASSPNSIRILRGSNFCNNCKDDRFNNLQRWGDYIGIQRWYGHRKVFIYGHVPDGNKDWRSEILVVDF